MVSGRDCEGCVQRKDPISVSQATEREAPAMPAVLSLSAKAVLHVVHLDSHGPRANTSALPINPALGSAQGLSNRNYFWWLL